MFVVPDGMINYIVSELFISERSEQSCNIFLQFCNDTCFIGKEGSMSVTRFRSHEYCIPVSPLKTKNKILHENIILTSMYSLDCH